MNLFLGKIVSSALQIVLFAAVPFLWWLATARKREPFPQWIGLKKMEGSRGKTLAAVAAVSLAFAALGVLILCAVRDIQTAVSEFEGLGAGAIPAIFVYAAFNTAFPEELLFRGFLLKRLAKPFGFAAANGMQALLFGLLHGAMFCPLTGALKAAAILLFTGAIAWVMGYINERQAGGSIFPSWMIHTAANLFSGVCAAFSIL